MSKGSNIRPRTVPKDQFDDNWDKAFSRINHSYVCRYGHKWNCGWPKDTIHVVDSCPTCGDAEVYLPVDQQSN